jgi:hypothetical protein
MRTALCDRDFLRAVTSNCINHMSRCSLWTSQKQWDKQFELSTLVTYSKVEFPQASWDAGRVNTSEYVPHMEALLCKVGRPFVRVGARNLANS